MVRWTPDGKSLFGLGVRPNGFGMVRWKSKKPFSTERKDWSKGRIVTDTSNPRKGVIDMAFSPDGKQMMAVANFDSAAFQLYLGDPKDLPLAEAEPLGVTGCKVAWRSDSKEVVIVQLDETCQGQAAGQIVRMPINKPSAQSQLGFIGDNPAFQPLTLE